MFDKLLPTIAGALIGAFSAALLSYAYQEYKSTQTLRILSRLLLDEAIKHSTWLDQTRLHDENQIKKFAEAIDIDVWDEMKFKLQGISFHDFELIRQHFKNMKEFKNTVEKYRTDQSIWPFPDELFLPYKLKCDNAIFALMSICYPQSRRVPHWIKIGINPIIKLTKKLVKKTTQGEDSIPFK